MESKCFIELKSRKEFPFKLDFTIDDTFFLDDEKPDVEGGALDVKVSVNNVGECYLIDVEVDGYLKVVCDRCLGIVSIPVHTTGNFRAKDFDGVDVDDDDIFLMQKGDSGITLDWTVYEMALLALPLQKVHKDGECDEAMMKLLSGYSNVDYNVNAEECADPRWEALKALKK